MRRRFRVGGLVLGVWLASAVPLGAQPLAWSVQWHPYSLQGYATVRLQVINLATAAIQASFTVPEGIVAGHGVLTPDGRYFLLPTSVGIARFFTNPPELDRILGAGVSVRELYIEPTGVRLHAVGDFGHAVLDWETGAPLSIDCCVQPRILFTPDGGTSVYFEPRGPRTAPTETVIGVFSEPAHSLRWSITVPGSVWETAISSSYLALESLGLEQILIWNLTDGSELGTLARTLTTGGLAWRGDTLLVSRLVSQNDARLSAFDLPDLDERVLRDVAPPVFGRIEALRIRVSDDGKYGYWLVYSGLQLFSSGTSYTIVDLDTAAVTAHGSFGPQWQRDFTLEAVPRCLFSVPALVPAIVPAEGGYVGIEVTPSAGCRPWTAPGTRNPGPHSGPATVLAGLTPSIAASPTSHELQIVGQRTTIQQASATPAAPTLGLEVFGNRATLTWTADIGAGVTSWVVRGARAGQPIADVATLTAGIHSWDSPPLPPGSYEIDVVGMNYAGRGPASTRLRFSIGVSQLPEAPTGLSASVVDDSVSLTWNPSSSGPAPASYLVEAAAAPSGAYVPVMTTLLPRATVPRAPIGSWEVRVRAQTAGGPGTASAPITVTTRACEVAPGPPQRPWRWTSYYPDTTTLRWLPSASGSVHEYVIEAGTVPGATDLGRVQVDGGSREYVIPLNFSSGWIQMRARNACGVSQAVIF